jgi:hypothetical protein
MNRMEWLLEIALIGLLAATLFHALRLERALGVLKRDRATLESLIAGFNTSTRDAEQGVERLCDAADGAGRQVARQIEAAGRLRDDLTFLTERGDRLADRLERLVRAGREIAPEPAYTPSVAAEPMLPVASEDDAAPRLRSQAERDLLKALRMVR